MIDQFKKEYYWLSNFWKSNVAFEGMLYPSVEHAFQAAKTLSTADRNEIRTADSPAMAKYAGKRIVLREDWEDVKLEIMEQLLVSKFENEWLRNKLLATGDQELIEGNYWHDTFWGVDKKTKEGFNHLGKLLMKLRKHLNTARIAAI